MWQNTDDLPQRLIPLETLISTAATYSLQHLKNQRKLQNSKEFFYNNIYPLSYLVAILHNITYLDLH